MFLFHHKSEEPQNTGTKVKICGIRRLESAAAALNAGADLLGFNFINEDHNYVNPITAKEIIEKVHKHTQVVGVFKDAEVEEINELVHYLKLHYVQLHGNESPSFIQKIKAKVVKEVSMQQDFSLDDTIPTLQEYNSHIFFDNSHFPYPIDYEKARELASRLPIFVGGLTPETVAEAVGNISPFGVDVSHGVEVNGLHSSEKIASFVRNAKAASQK